MLMGERICRVLLNKATCATLRISSFRLSSTSVACSANDPESLPRSFVEERHAIWKKFPPTTTTTMREAWVEDLKSKTLGPLITLHPNVWAVRPRLDILYDNVLWQEQYRRVDYDYVKDRHELKLLGPKKPWPHKGTGRSRQRSHRSPLWIQGGKCHGPKGPTTHFYMLSYEARISGLIQTLSAKFAQDDVHFVADLELHTDQASFMEELIDSRNWGLSTLLVSGSDIFPRNITAATSTLLHVNLLPLSGLNVHSMIMHKTLVLTLDALNQLESRILFAQRRIDRYEKRIAASTHGDVVF